MESPCAYVWKVLLAGRCGYVKIFGEKKQAFWVETFSSIKKWVFTPFRQTFRPDNWVLRERYGGPNFGEKEFQLFKFL